MHKLTFLLLPLVGTLASVGNFLKAQDENNTGKDDVIGSLCVSSAEALNAVVVNNDKGLRRALEAARDGINSYLAQMPATVIARDTNALLGTTRE